MSIPYETATSGERALAEIQRNLAKFGCHSFGTMIDRERGVTMVQFRHHGRTVSLEASWNGYASMLLKDKPFVPHKTRGTKAEHEAKTLKQAQVSVCSVLRDYVKAQTTAIECGTIQFEAAFLAHLLLPSGERLIDRVRSDKLLPAPTGV